MATRDPANATTGGTRTDSAIEANFTVKYKNTDIGWFRECSGLSAEFELMDWPEGGENNFVHKLPGRLKYPNIVLKAGVTAVAELTEWLNATETELADQRASVEIILVNHLGTPVRKWIFAKAFPVKWVGPNLNVNSNNYAVETLELCHEGLQRSTSS